MGKQVTQIGPKRCKWKLLSKTLRNGLGIDHVTQYYLTQGTREPRHLYTSLPWSYCLLPGFTSSVLLLCTGKVTFWSFKNTLGQRAADSDSWGEWSPRIRTVGDEMVISADPQGESLHLSTSVSPSLQEARALLQLLIGGLRTKLHSWMCLLWPT